MAGNATDTTETTITVTIPGHHVVSVYLVYDGVNPEPEVSARYDKEPAPVEVATTTYIDGIRAPLRVTARFSAQVWVRDQAMEVDPLGDTEWDASTAFAELNAEYREQLIAEMDEHGEALDGDDALKHDPNAPAWVQEWPGPFSLYVWEA